MKNQYYAIFGINGENVNTLYNFCVDVEVEDNAENTAYRILCALSDKFNQIYSSRKISWSDISMKLLTKLN